MQLTFCQNLKPAVYIDAIISSNFFGFITECLRTSTDDAVSYEIAWILTNIAAGNSDQTAAVVRNGALDVLMAKIRENISTELKDQILWCVANVIGDGYILRNEALERGVIDVIGRLLVDPETRKKSIRHNIAWILSNILRPAEHPVNDEVFDAIYQMLKKLTIENVDDTNVIGHLPILLFY